MNRVGLRVVFGGLTVLKSVQSVNFHLLSAKPFSPFFLSPPLTLNKLSFRSLHTDEVEVPSFSFLREDEVTQSQIEEFYNQNLFEQALSIFKRSPSLHTADGFWNLIEKKNKSDYSTSLKESMEIYNVLVESKFPLNHYNYVKLMSLANLVTPTTTFDLFIDATKNNIKLNQPLFHQITVAIIKTKNTQMVQNIISMLSSLHFVPFENDLLNLLTVALHPSDAFEVVNFMLKKNLLTDHLAFIKLIDICLNSDLDPSKLRNMEKIQSMLNQTKLQKNDSVLNHLIEAYLKLSSTQNGWMVLELVQAPTIGIFSKFVDAFLNTREFEKVIEVYDKMISNNVTPNEFTFTNILTAIYNLGPKAIEKGKQIHQQITQHKFDSDVILVNTLIHMYNKCGEPNKSIEVYDTMISNNIIPTEITLNNVLGAISNVGSKALKKGKQIHQQITQQKLDSNIQMTNSLIHMYNKCREPNKSIKVYDKMIASNITPTEFTFVNILTAILQPRTQSNQKRKTNTPTNHTTQT